MGAQPKFRSMPLDVAHPDWRENAEAWVRRMQDGERVFDIRIFEDGTYAVIKALMFHYTIIYGALGDVYGYDNRWCYGDRLAPVQAALAAWDYPEQKEPEGWQRHPDTGRRRPNGDPSKEYIDP